MAVLEKAVSLENLERVWGKIKRLLKGTHAYELIWENASTSSAFAAQTIELDLSGYKGVAIKYKVNGSSSTIIYDDNIQIGESRTAYVTFNITNSNTAVTGRRLAEADNDGVTFDDYGYKNWNNPTTAITTTAAYLIPYQIYGIKEVA